MPLEDTLVERITQLENRLKELERQEGGSGVADYILLRDKKSDGTDAGGSTATTWVTRDLNQEVLDAGGHCSLSSNQFTLAAGTYRIRAHAPAFRAEVHAIRLYNVSDAGIEPFAGTAVDMVGTSETSDSADSYAATRSFLEGRFTIASSKTLRIEHWVQAAKAGNGFGRNTNSGDGEIYTVVELWKEA